MRLLGTIIVATGAATMAASVAANDDGVLICHRTDSERVPYVQLFVTQTELLGPDGHTSHSGPLFADGIDGQWGDIIPPFEYSTADPSSSTALFPGSNWPAGEAIWAADCLVDSPQGESGEIPIDSGEADTSVPVEIADPGALALEEEVGAEQLDPAVPTSIPAGGGAASGER